MRRQTDTARFLKGILIAQEVITLDIEGFIAVCNLTVKAAVEVEVDRIAGSKNCIFKDDVVAKREGHRFTVVQLSRMEVHRGGDLIDHAGHNLSGNVAKPERDGEHRVVAALVIVQCDGGQRGNHFRLRQAGHKINSNGQRACLSGPTDIVNCAAVDAIGGKRPVGGAGFLEISFPGLGIDQRQIEGITGIEQFIAFAVEDLLLRNRKSARRLFGMGAVKVTEKIDMIVKLELWDPKKAYDRMGMENEYATLLGIQVPCLTIPVKPGRNLAIILEVAAMNNRQKKMGYNAAQELMQNLGMPVENSTSVKNWDLF